MQTQTRLNPPPLGPKMSQLPVFVGVWFDPLTGESGQTDPRSTTLRVETDLRAIQAQCENIIETWVKKQ
jgi:hypothetical protein